MGHIRKGRIIIMPPHPYAQHPPTHSEPTHQRDSRFSYSRLMTSPSENIQQNLQEEKKRIYFRRRFCFLTFPTKRWRQKNFLQWRHQYFYDDVKRFFWVRIIERNPSYVLNRNTIGSSEWDETNFGAGCLKRGEEVRNFPLCNFLKYFFHTQFKIIILRILVNQFQNKMQCGKLILGRFHQHVYAQLLHAQITKA